jgi:hypothetical protein
LLCSVQDAIKISFEQTPKGFKAEIEPPLSIKGVFKWKNEKRELKVGEQTTST